MNFPFEIRQPTSNNMGVFGAVLAALLLAGCLGMKPRPAGFSEHVERRHLIVSETFQFTMVTGVFKVRTTLGIPKGAYSMIASDTEGDYYLTPGPRAKISARHLFPDYYRGGIYRRNSSPPRYFVFSLPASDMEYFTRGQYPVLVTEIPQSVARFIRVESRLPTF